MAKDEPPSADDRRTCNGGSAEDELRRAVTNVIPLDGQPGGAAAAQHPARRASRSGEPNLAGPAELCDKRGRFQPWRGRRCRAPGVLAGVRGRRFARAARMPLRELMTSRPPRCARRHRSAGSGRTCLGNPLRPERHRGWLPRALPTAAARLPSTAGDQPRDRGAFHLVIARSPVRRAVAAKLRGHGRRRAVGRFGPFQRRCAVNCRSLPRTHLCLPRSRRRSHPGIRRVRRGPERR
jgi:hypothetical protein